ncbi:signal recognition particle subunit SRP19/SEC65 family protein [Methanobacterium alcaliphilum]|uniref:signal recognition particle subunit SRP19/SEC65 family protein n=1 Tax=Methanobacterium alcaliphilum TaxID=392018 RepID=UPI0031843606
MWPVYIDSKRSRNEGRKIPKDDAVSAPSLSEISRAARKLNFSPETESSKSYPGLWYESSGRVIVERNEISKKELLLKISNMINGSRKNK